MNKWIVQRNLGAFADIFGEFLYKGMPCRHLKRTLLALGLSCKGFLKVYECRFKVNLENKNVWDIFKKWTKQLILYKYYNVMWLHTGWIWKPRWGKNDIDEVIPVCRGFAEMFSINPCTNLIKNCEDYVCKNDYPTIIKLTYTLNPKILDSLMAKHMRTKVWGDKLWYEFTEHKWMKDNLDGLTIKKGENVVMKCDNLRKVNRQYYSKNVDKVMFGRNPLGVNEKYLQQKYCKGKNDKLMKNTKDNNKKFSNKMR